MLTLLKVTITLLRINLINFGFISLFNLILTKNYRNWNRKLIRVSWRKYN